MKPSQTLSHFSVNLRGALNVAIAGAVFLGADSTWREMVGPRGVMFTGLIGVLLAAWRNFLDRSDAQRKPDEPTPPATGDTVPA